MKPTAKRSYLRRLLLTACASAPFAAHADPLYKWSFNDSTGIPSITAGGGTLLPNGTANFTAAGASGLVGDNALGLTNSYTGGVGSGNSVVAGTTNVLTGVGTLSTFTVTMWVKLTAGDLSNFPRLLQLGATATPDSNSNPGINMLLNSGALEIGVNSRNAQVPAAFAADQWKFIVFTYDGDATNPYFSAANNGLYAANNNAVVLTGSLTNSVTVTGSRGLNTGAPSFNVSPGAAAIGATATLYLGNRPDGGRGFTGSIDDVRIYNTQLTLAELEAIRLETAPPPPTGGTPYFWKGDASSSWNANNWTSDLAGTTLAPLPVDGTAAATFAATGAINFATTALAADQNVKSLAFNTQATAVEIGGTHNLTVGSGGITLDADAGTVSINTTGQVALAANQTWTNKAATPFTISSVLSGAFTLTTAGPGQTVLSAANTHAGTTLESGTLTIQNALALGPVGSPLNVTGGTLDLNGLSPEVGNLQGSTLGIVTNRLEATTSTLLVTTPALATDTFGGHLNNGSVSQVVALTKAGPGSLTLTSTSNFTGNVLVSAGTLVATTSLFIAPSTSNLGNAQFPGRTVTVATGATLRFGNTNILGNGTGDLSSLPRFIIENGGTFTADRYNVLGDVTLNGGTLANASTDAGTRLGFQFKGLVTADGAAASVISTSNNKANHLDANTAFEVGTGSSLTISTALADQSADFASATGGFTKYGPGTLTLGAANTYTGPTTLTAGKLVLSSATSLSDTAAFEVSNSAVGTLELNYVGSDTVASVTINGSSPGAGTYGRIGSGATHTYSWITGDGLIFVDGPTATPLQTWRQTYFSTMEATGNAANDADPDFDGIANLMEYALGSDPIVASTALLPVSAIATGQLTLTFNRIADPALVYTVVARDDLTTGSWTSIFTSTGVDNTAGAVVVTDPELLSAHPRRFLRLEVTTAP